MDGQSEVWSEPGLVGLTTPRFPPLSLCLSENHSNGKSLWSSFFFFFGEELIFL